MNELGDRASGRSKGLRHRGELSVHALDVVADSGNLEAVAAPMSAFVTVQRSLPFVWTATT